MAKDPLSEMIGVDLRELHGVARRDGVFLLRGRIGTREVEGEYDPLVFHLKYAGRADDGEEITNDFRGKSHADMAARFGSLVAWLRGQEHRTTPVEPPSL